MTPRTYFSRPGAYSLVSDEHRGTYLLSIPVSTGHADYSEPYALTEQQFAQFVADPRLGKLFADECRRREHDDLLTQQPGTNRGLPREPDESPEVQSAIMFLDTVTRFPLGFALGIHVTTGERYLSVPAVRDDPSEEWVHFGISSDELDGFEADVNAAVAFAQECRRGDHQRRLLPRL